MLFYAKLFGGSDNLCKFASESKINDDNMINFISTAWWWRNSRFK